MMGGKVYRDSEVVWSNMKMVVGKGGNDRWLGYYYKFYFESLWCEYLDWKVCSGRL